MQNQFLLNQMNNCGMMNQMNNCGMMNQMNNFGMMNQMNNFGMMNQMNNFEMMYQMINCGMMNQKDFFEMMNQMANCGMMNQMNKNLENTSIMVKVLFLFGNKEKEIIINKEMDYISLKTQLLSIMKSEGIILYREASSKEVIIRNSPNETLEFLLKRGVEETNPYMKIIDNFNHEKMISSPIDIKNIKEGDKISLYIPLRGAGGPFLEFVDLDEISKTQKLKFSNKAPKWRKVSEGLNLFGKCINSKCEAYNKEVVYKAGINIKFDFFSDRKKIKCPICSKNFIPSTTGFWKCEYQIKGEKLKDGEYQQVDLNGMETKGNDFEYYDIDENGKVNWSKLKIFACHRQEMKYRKK